MDSIADMELETPSPDSPQAEVVIYTTTFCSFCYRAKMLMNNKGIAYREINLDEQPERRREMIALAEGRRTVPQIFINGRGIGGCNEIYSLEHGGKLDELLAANG